MQRAVGQHLIVCRKEKHRSSSIHHAFAGHHRHSGDTQAGQNVSAEMASFPELVCNLLHGKPDQSHATSQVRSQIVLDFQVPQDCSCKQVPEYPTASHQQQPEAYQQQYPGVPQYPGPPPQYNQRGSSSGGGLPTVVWVIVGAVIATIVSKVAGVLRTPGGVQGWVSAPLLLPCAAMQRRCLLDAACIRASIHALHAVCCNTRNISIICL